MIWQIKPGPLGTALFGLVILSACADISYVDHGPSSTLDQLADEPSAFTRQVDYHLGSAFYATLPTCVMVLPIQIKGIDRKTASTIEDTVSRYTSTRFDKTLSARHLKSASRRLAFDPAHKDDRKRLGRRLNCDAYMEIKTTGVDNLYAVFWANISVGVQLTLLRSRDDVVLWRAKHKARRGDGGLPISLLGVGAGTFSAGKLATDTDALPSVVDDAVRRMMVSLPDIRRF